MWKKMMNRRSAASGLKSLKEHLTLPAWAHPRIVRPLPYLAINRLLFLYPFLSTSKDLLLLSHFQHVTFKRSSRFQNQQSPRVQN